MMNNIVKLGSRLSAVAAMVRRGVTLYDIGSDHAYLPTFLIQSGKTPFAYVCDVASGPLSKAESTVKAYGVEEKCRLCLSDGLKSIDIIPPCDIVIAGMGGELISKIISASEEVKNGDIRLVLQPMTKAEELRQYLSENGFEFLSEVTVTEGKSYTVISCRYIGKSGGALSPSELLLGKKEIRQEDKAFFDGAEAKLETLITICEGKRRGGEAHPSEENLIAEIREIIKRGEKL